MKKIIFTNLINDYEIYPPKPAIKNVAEWYKETPEYVLGDSKQTTLSGEYTPHTIKKCMPVFDSMTLGYILYTQVQVQVVQQENDFPLFRWPSQDVIAFHPIEQAPLHPKNNAAPYPKWNNPYSIKTPPGYSTLFLPPMHNPNGIFTILEGVVDTDKFNSLINFPFILNNVKWEGIIEAGTPIAQAIPFKRDSWKQIKGSEKEKEDAQMIKSSLKNLLFNSYKKQFWSRKDYM